MKLDFGNDCKVVGSGEGTAYTPHRNHVAYTCYRADADSAGLGGAEDSSFLTAPR